MHFLVLLLPDAAASPPLPPTRGRALLVGVSRFDAETTLPGSERAAEALGRLLHGEYGMTVTLMTRERAKDDPRLAPDSRRVKRLLKAIAEDAGKDDTLLLFFATHGTQQRGAKDAMLALSDTRLDDPASGLLLSEVYAALGKSKARQKLVIIDACRSPVGVDLTDAKSRVASVDLPDPPAGVAALMSATPGEISWQVPQFGQGTFTYYLLKRWQEAAAKGEAVYASTLFAGAKRETEAFTRLRIGQVQRPQRQGADAVLAAPGRLALRAGLRAKERRGWKAAEEAFAAPVKGLFGARGRERTARLLAERSLAMLERGDRKGAALEADEALAASSDFPPALRARAAAHLAHDEYRAALERCDQGLLLEPADAG
ncbi:MAG: caspase family protein, partial [Gemmataceae bacterium]|nr:caspase family protein [Gemmataceae bacterium]